MIRHRVLYCGQQGQRKREAGEPELIASEVTVLHVCQRWHLAHADLKVETEGSWEWLSLGALGAETPVLRQSGSQPQMRYVRGRAQPPACYNSTASLQSLAGFTPHLLGGGGPPSLDVPEGGHIIVYRFLEFRLIHSGLLLCAVGPRASL